jgi:hypothetical protein
VVAGGRLGADFGRSRRCNKNAEVDRELPFMTASADGLAAIEKRTFTRAA